MKSRLTSCVIIAIGMMCLPISVSCLFAQNPLRNDDSVKKAFIPESHSNYYGEGQRQQPSTIHYGRDQAASSQNWIAPAINSDVREPRKHDALMLAQYQEIPKPDNGTSPQKRPSVLGSTISENWQNPKELVDLVMKISLNLFFVLSFAFGVLLLMKKWNKPKLIDNEKERVKSDSLSILQTLRIDSKISIRLVKWRSNRFLVACDQNGIQSVNPLNASFDQTLQEMEQEDSSDEQLIRKLLSGLDMARG